MGDLGKANKGLCLIGRKPLLLGSVTRPKNALGHFRLQTWVGFHEVHLSPVFKELFSFISTAETCFTLIWTMLGTINEISAMFSPLMATADPSANVSEKNVSHLENCHG